MKSKKFQGHPTKRWKNYLSFEWLVNLNDSNSHSCCLDSTTNTLKLHYLWIYIKRWSLLALLFFAVGLTASHFEHSIAIVLQLSSAMCMHTASKALKHWLVARQALSQN